MGRPVGTAAAAVSVEAPEWWALTVASAPFSKGKQRIGVSAKGLEKSSVCRIKVVDADGVPVVFRGWARKGCTSGLFGEVSCAWHARQLYRN